MKEGKEKKKREGGGGGGVTWMMEASGVLMVMVRGVGRDEQEGIGAKERETPKGSASVLVSEVEERSGERQWQPPGEEAPVYSPALRP